MVTNIIPNEPPSSAQIVLLAEDLLEEILLRVRLCTISNSLQWLYPLKDYSVLEMQNQLPSSVETVVSIDDLLMEIFLRLPAESILRFKLVSKYWYSLITSPEFSLWHRRKPRAATGILSMHRNFHSNGIYEFVPLSIENPASPPFRKLKFTDDPSLGIRIRQSCNGLLLCSSFKLVPELGEVQYFVCNPTTKRFVTLPGLETSIVSHGMSLAFDPAKSPHYKVVCVAKNLSNACFHMEVYSSETKSWRKSVEVFTADFNFGNFGVYWNGAIHWIFYKDWYYFKVDVETLHMMPMPPTYLRKCRHQLVESCDHLHLIEAEYKPSGVNFMFYEMNRDHSEWFVKYHIDRSLLIDQPYLKLSLLALVQNKEDDDDAYLVLVILGKVVRYHLLKSTHQVCDESYLGYETEHELGYLPHANLDGPQFIESLCSV